MKRSMDLVRRIAVAAEALPAGEHLSELDGVTAAEFNFHVTLMHEAGLVDARNLGVPIGGATVVLRLTWEGCEFVDATRDETLWQKAKQQVLAPTASFTFGLLKEWLKKEVMQGFPTLRP